MPAPASTPALEPKPAAEPDPVTKADQAKPKRASRRAGGIPADVVALMTSVFGEGITYTSEPTADEPDEDAELAMQDDSYDENDAAESEYADEPVDDADYEEEN